MTTYKLNQTPEQIRPSISFDLDILTFLFSSFVFFFFFILTFCFEKCEGSIVQNLLILTEAKVKEGFGLCWTSLQKNHKVALHTTKATSTTFDWFTGFKNPNSFYLAEGKPSKTTVI